MGQALGIIQSDGLTALIAAMDTALKTADVTVGQVELVKGGSMVLVKISGGISDVRVAVEAGVLAAQKISNGNVIGSVIGNPQIGS